MVSLFRLIDFLSHIIFKFAMLFIFRTYITQIKKFNFRVQNLVYPQTAVVQFTHPHCYYPTINETHLRK